jgi:hypothetical protein
MDFVTILGHLHAIEPISRFLFIKSTITCNNNASEFLLILPTLQSVIVQVNFHSIHRGRPDLLFRLLPRAVR